MFRFSLGSDLPHHVANLAQFNHIPGKSANWPQGDRYAGIFDTRILSRFELLHLQNFLAGEGAIL